MKDFAIGGKNATAAFKLPLYFFSICYFLLTVWFFTARVQFFADNLPVNRILKLILIAGICGCAVLFIAVWPVVKRACAFFVKAVRNTSSKKLLLITVLTCFVLKIIFLFALKIDSTKQEDCYYYWSFIRQLTEKGVITNDTEYATRYFYTVIYSLFFMPATKIFGTKSILICNAYLTVLFTIASVLLYDTLKYRFGKNYAFTAVLIWNVIPAGVLQPLFLCHENAFVFFHIVTIWLLFRVFPSAKAIIAKVFTVLAAAAVIAFASAINMFGYVSIIAIFLVSFLFCFNKEKVVKSIVCLLALLLVFTAAVYTTQTAVNSIKDTVIEHQGPTGYENGWPLGWALYTGASYDYRGACNDEDYEKYYKNTEFNSPDEAVNYQKELVKNRYREYLNNPLRFIRHLNNKMIIMSKAYYPLSFSRGTNYGTSRLSNIIYNSFNGYLNYAIEGVFSLINIVTAFVLMMSFSIKTIPSQSSLQTYFKLFMLGVCGILLFVEVSSKYASILLFVYLTVMTLGIKDFIHNMDCLNGRLSERIPPLKKLK